MEVYSPLKVFAFPDRCARARHLKAPVHVRIKPINACNHNCWFCAYRAENLSLGEQMELRDRIPYPKLVEIANDAIEMGVRAITFSGGGEPLLYPNIASIVDLLGRGGVAVAALTNGAYLKDDVAEAFARYGTWVRVSMDGWDDDSYARFRHCKPGEFTRISENIAAFAARGSRCEIGVSLIVSRENAERVEELCRFLRSLGVTRVKISAAIVADDGPANEAYHAPIRQTVAAQIVAARELENERFAVADHYHGFESSFSKAYRSCPMLELLTVIGADCNVYTCQDKAYETAGLLGSIARRPFAEFWFSRETAERMSALNPSTDCDHHCVAHAKNLLLTEFRGLDPAHLAFV